MAKNKEEYIHISLLMVALLVDLTFVLLQSAPNFSIGQLAAGAILAIFLCYYLFKGWHLIQQQLTFMVAFIIFIGLSALTRGWLMQMVHMRYVSFVLAILAILYSQILLRVFHLK